MIDITVLENRLHLVHGYKGTTQDGEDIKNSFGARGWWGCVMWVGNMMGEQGDACSRV